MDLKRANVSGDLYLFRIDVERVTSSTCEDRCFIKDKDGFMVLPFCLGSCDPHSEGAFWRRREAVFCQHRKAEKINLTRL